ncbi:pyrroline-5-carboxylate reductase [Batrachochytrium salamandrivorans]|nr:pyrroline-5-carboxylate reductase [Batrachochytrium salamandrivorans]
MGLKVGFCGYGVMSSSLAQGLLAKDSSFQILAFDPVLSKEEQAKHQNVRFVASNKDLALAVPDLLFLGVKPQYLASVCQEIKSALNVEKTLVVSIAAGVTAATLESYLAPKTRVVRTMPNICCTVGRMASGACVGKSATGGDLDLVVKVLNLVGLCTPVANEDLLHAVTGVSGSGPAYIFLVIEALADGGVKNGLPRATALELASHMVRGAAEMVITNKQHPGVLKDQVCSPGGTTIAGVAKLEECGLRSALIQAVTATVERSKELSKI